MKLLHIGIFGSILLAQTVAAQGLVTLSVKGRDAEQILEIDQTQTATIKTWLDSGLGGSWSVCSSIDFSRGTNLLTISPDQTTIWNFRGTVIAGPAKFRLYHGPGANPAAVTMLTLDIQPSQYPPDKAAVVGPHSGPVKVTMENSFDLVNWTAAVNGGTYTNSPDARFFRIKIEKDVSAP
jgi:hypothetical protein